MQLMLAIVQNDDADLLSKRFSQAGLKLTRLSSFGGFLASGNVTILCAMEQEQIEGALEIVRKTCRTRRRYLHPVPAGAEPAHLALGAPAFPLEVVVGGATVFFIPIRRFLRVGQRDVTAGGQDAAASKPSETGANVMNLVLAILQNEDAEPVTNALIAAGHRVTRINTAGGFLRRGNITILVGVDESGVDDVLRIITDNCRQQTATSDSEPPSYGATAFVLESARFVRV